MAEDLLQHSCSCCNICYKRQLSILSLRGCNNSRRLVTDNVAGGAIQPVTIAEEEVTDIVTLVKEDAAATRLT